MFDVFGDGWNGNIFDVINFFGVVVVLVTLFIGFLGLVDFCLLDDCYLYFVGGGSWQFEVFWVLFDVLGVVVVMGIVFQIGVFVVGSGFCIVLGCIDLIVLNFDLMVNIDDGSCVYSCVVFYYEDFDGGFGSWI